MLPFAVRVQFCFSDHPLSIKQTLGPFQGWKTGARPPLRLHPGDVLIKGWTIPGKIQVQTPYPNHSKKEWQKHCIYIRYYQSVCVCYKYICILCIYTQRCVCMCVCVWFELHCTNTFSPAKGCLELVDSSQAPWHLAYCGEIVLLTHSGRTWQTSKSKNLRYVIEFENLHLHDIFMTFQRRTWNPKKSLSWTWL